MTTFINKVLLTDGAGAADAAGFENKSNMLFVVLLWVAVVVLAEAKLVNRSDVLDAPASSKYNQSDTQKTISNIS